MHPFYYCEALVHTEQGDNSSAFTRSILFRLLHGYFAHHPEQYALDILPGCRGLRIFASTQDHIDTLRGYLTQQSFTRDYLRLTEARPVPSGFTGPWVVCSRFRIPTLKSDRHEGATHGQLRAQRLRHVKQERMDYFSLSSKSTNQAFSLCVQRTRVETGSPDAKPNTYGLSTTTNPCPIPDLS